MKPQSAKAKGRKLQQFVRDALLMKFPSLTKDDVRSTSMGAGGEDIQLSQAARELIPYNIECKARKSFALYKDYEQAKAHGDGEPMLVIKGDYKEPLVVVSFKYFMENRDV